MCIFCKQATWSSCKIINNGSYLGPAWGLMKRKSRNEKNETLPHLTWLGMLHFLWIVGNCRSIVVLDIWINTTSSTVMADGVAWRGVAGRDIFCWRRHVMMQAPTISAIFLGFPSIARCRCKAVQGPSPMPVGPSTRQVPTCNPTKLASFITMDRHDSRECCSLAQAQQQNSACEMPTK